MTDQLNPITPQEFVEILGIALGYHLPVNQGIIIEHNNVLVAVANNGSQIITAPWNEELSENLKDSEGNRLEPNPGVRFNFLDDNTPTETPVEDVQA